MYRLTLGHLKPVMAQSRSSVSSVPGQSRCPLQRLNPETTVPSWHSTGSCPTHRARQLERASLGSYGQTCAETLLQVELETHSIAHDSAAPNWLKQFVRPGPSTPHSRCFFSQIAQ